MRKRFKIKKAFTSLLMSYVIMLILPSIFMWILYQQALNMTVENCVDNSVTMLLQAGTVFDKYVDSLDDRAMDLVYDMGFKAMMHAKKPQPAESNVYDIVKFNNRLYDKLSFIGEDTGYFVIFKENEFVFTNNTVIYGLKFYYENSRTYLDMTYDEWFQQTFDINKREFIPLSPIKLNGKVLDAITYNYPIMGGNNRNIGGVVQFFITREYVEGLFSPIYQQDNGTVYILDEKGEVMARIGKQEQWIANDFSQIKRNEGYFYSKDSGKKKIVVYTKSSNSGFTFAVSLPEEAVMKKAINVKRMAIFAIVLCGIAELLFCFSFSWKYATPINNLVKNLRNIFSDDVDRGSEETNEYEYLESSVSHLIHNSQYMQSTIEQEEKRLRQYFVDSLLEGQFKDREKLMQLAEQVGIFFDAKMYCVASFQVEEKATEVGEYLLRKSYKDRGVLILHIYDEQIVTVLFGLNKRSYQENRNKAISVLMDMNKDVYNILHSYVSIGIGRMYEDVMDIFFSFSQSCYSATVQSQERQDYILEYEFVSQDMNTIYYPLEMESKLINSTKYTEIKQIEMIFQEIHVENIQRRKLSSTMQYMLVANIEATLLKVYSDVVLDRRIDDVIEIIHKYTELSDILQELEHQFILVSEYVEKNRNDQADELVNHMKEYVMNNYKDSMLCISSMATHFGLSESYFSQLFKEKMGSPFSNYLENIRIEKAKELILNNDLGIEQISATVGYNNSSTFRRAFKRVMGMTPSALKDQNND